jgi:hypothetical protein
MPPGGVTSMVSASTYVTVPFFAARTSRPELVATSRSMPVATTGGSVTKSGTACRCMLEPMRARLASSCSRNGIRPADTPTIWLGATSMYSMSSAGTSTKSPL